MPDDLEELLGTERYQAWLAISVVERKVFCDRLDEQVEQIVAHKYEPIGAVIFGLRERGRLGL